MLKSQYLDFAVLTMVEDDPEIDSSPVAHDAVYLFGHKGCGLAELTEISMAYLSERTTIRQYNATVVAKRTDKRPERLARTQNAVIKISEERLEGKKSEREYK